MSDRLEKIRALLAEDPEDKFLRYSLAMEHRSGNDFDAAMQQFESLMGDSPPHVPAFFMAAQMLVEREDIEPARDLLRRGIDHAREQADHHAAAEMSELLASLGSYGEL